MSTHAISFFSSVSNIARFFSTAVFSAKADAKIQPFSNTPKYFFKNFLSVMPTALSYSAMRLKKIFTHRGFPPRKTAPPGPKRGKIGAAGALNGVSRGQNAVSHCATAIWQHRSLRGGESYQQRRPLPSPTEPLRTRYGRSSVVLQWTTEILLKSYREMPKGHRCGSEGDGLLITRAARRQSMRITD